MVAGGRLRLSWSLRWKAQALLVIFQPLIWADCWGHPSEHQLFPPHWLPLQSKIFHLQERGMEKKSLRNTPHNTAVDGSGMPQQEKYYNFTEHSKPWSDNASPVCVSVFVSYSFLKGQCVILIIIRYNLMKNWCARLDWCYFIWGRASHHISPPCLLIPSPPYQLVFTKPCRPRVCVRNAPQLYKKHANSMKL